MGYATLFYQVGGIGDVGELGASTVQSKNEADWTIPALFGFAEASLTKAKAAILAALGQASGGFGGILGGIETCKSIWKHV